MSAPEKVVIRTAAQADARLLSVLGIVTFYEAYFEQDDPADMAAYVTETYSVERMNAELEDRNSTHFIVFLGGVAVGFAKLLRDSRAEGVRGGRTIQLKRIYLVERVWGKGLGAPLLEHCIAMAKAEGCDSIWLDVWERNERGLRFYRKHGFEKVGTMTFPYGDTVGINHVMEKSTADL